METSPTATWFQSEEAYECFLSCSAWLTPFLVQVRRGGRLVGSVAGYVTKESCAVKQHFTARAVIFGGPLLSDDITETELATLLADVTKETGKRNAIYSEMRNFHDYSKWRSGFEQAGWSYVPHYDIYIDCRDKEAMVNRIHESKLRAVRKAQAEGQVLSEATTEQQVRDWYRQLKTLYKTRVHRPLWPVEFFLSVWRGGYAKLLILQCSNPPAQHTAHITHHTSHSGLSAEGGIFCVKDSNTLYEWYICGQTMVTYGALEYAADHGLEKFDLMGAGEPGVPYGVRDFKMQFGGCLHEFGRFRLIHKPLLYRLGKRIVALSSCLT